MYMYAAKGLTIWSYLLIPQKHNYPLDSFELYAVLHILYM